MSRENVELLHRWRESWSRQDAEATLACLRHDVVIDFSDALGPFKGVYLGHDQVRRLLRSMWEAWDSARIDFAEVLDCGPDGVVTVNTFKAQGRSSGVVTGAHVANLWSFRDGLISRGQLFQSKAEALEAAGRPRE